MNLVIDDAVEVKQATKIDEEKRRELGIDASRTWLCAFANSRPKARYF